MSLGVLIDIFITSMVHRCTVYPFHVIPGNAQQDRVGPTNPQLASRLLSRLPTYRSALSCSSSLKTSFNIYVASMGQEARCIRFP